MAEQERGTSFWLLKTEPRDYTFGDLQRQGSTMWEGVENNAALKHMRTMQPGDLALIYHTGDERQAVGLAEITSSAYPDPRPDADGLLRPATLVVVDLRPLRQLPRPVTLAAVKADPFFADFALVRQSRLSVVPVSQAHWHQLLRMAGEEI